jgi:hypothetical protein
LSQKYHTGRQPVFYLLHIAIKRERERERERIKSAKIKWFLRFSIAKIQPKFQENHQIFLGMVQGC